LEGESLNSDHPTSSEAGSTQPADPEILQAELVDDTPVVAELAATVADTASSGHDTENLSPTGAPIIQASAATRTPRDRLRKRARPDPATAWFTDLAKLSWVFGAIALLACFGAVNQRYSAVGTTTIIVAALCAFPGFLLAVVTGLESLLLGRWRAMAHSLAGLTIGVIAMFFTLVAGTLYSADYVSKKSIEQRNTFEEQEIQIATLQQEVNRIQGKIANRKNAAREKQRQMEQAQAGLAPRTNVLSNVPLRIERFHRQPLRMPNELAGEKTSLDGAVITRLPRLVPGLVEPPTWSSDGKSVYVVWDSGEIGQMTVPEFRQTRSIRLNGDNLGCALCGGLMVVQRTGPPELILLDERTLSARGRVKLPVDSPVYGSPLTKMLVVGAICPSRGVPYVRLFDLRTGTASDQLGVPVVDHAAMTRDGKYYLVADRGRLSRYAVRGNRLVREQSSATMPGTPERLVLDLGSRYLFYVTASEIEPDTGLPRQRTARLFHVHDLSQPVHVFKLGRFPRAVGLDPKSALVYIREDDISLKIRDFRGSLVREIDLPGPRDEANWLLPHPDGGKLFVPLGEDLLWVELPDLPRLPVSPESAQAS
jgi:hypothetical protein